MEARRIDRYQILEEVGSGGMAVVYRGVDTALHREVAVKVMHPHLASREESRRRFSREARAVARLRHPSIVEIYDFSDDDTRQSFIVTEFVPGRTLRAFADEVGFGLPELAVMAAHQLAEALEHAHENGIVHRDLKPENVMVRSDGQLKLMDFGIARILEGERMTMTGALVGSPLHMAPEIIEGKDAGESADIFALGTILYWMITGEMAFAGNNTTQTLRRILEGQFRDPRLLAPSCSDELADLVASCLSREPSDRPETMAGFRLALEGVLSSAGIDRPGESLQAFFLDPEPARESLRGRMVARLVAEGEAALAQKRPARAVSAFDRVLALDEGNETVLLYLEKMKRSRIVRQRLRMTSAAGLLGVVLAGGIWGFVGDRQGDPAETGAEAGRVDGSEGPGTLRSVDEGTSDVPATVAGTGQREPSGSTGPGEQAPPGSEAPGSTATEEQVPSGSEAQGLEGTGSLVSSGVEGSGLTGTGQQVPTAPGATGLSGTGQQVSTVSAAPGPTGTGQGSEPPVGKQEPTSAQPGKDRRQAPSFTRGVHIRWVPQSAVLSIDGKKVETTAPAWSGELPQGSHTLTLTHPDCCQPWEETIEIDSQGAPLRRSIALVPRESGWFEVDSDEGSAGVWVDGTFKGTVAEVNARGGVPVSFSREDTGRERYLKTVRFQLLPPRGRGDLQAFSGEVIVRAGQKSRSQRIQLEASSP